MSVFKIGFSTIGCPDATIDEVIALATASGYVGVELRHLEGSVDLTTVDELSSARLAETRRKFDDAGLAVVAIDTSARFVSLDEAERRTNFDHVRAYTEIAVALGAGYLRLFGGDVPDGQDPDATIDAIAEGLNAAAEISAESGVQSLLETHDSFGTSDSIHRLEAHGLSDSYGILWDTLHTIRNGEAPRDTWQAFGERIKHVHVKDSPRADASGFDLVLTGQGVIPIPDVLALLREVGYDGFVDFEWEKAWHPELPDATIAFPHFMEYMRGLGY